MKTALVTGAAQGVGFAAAALLGRLGYAVVLLDVKPLDARVRELQDAGTQAIGISGDVAAEPFVRELADRVAREYGALDALVNNAGISLIVPAEQTTAEQWQQVMNVNLFGPFLLCKYLGAQMLSRGRGSIVNVASVAGLSGIAHRSAYNA
jgi:NAD(P)-dependent dehydrogenase (short-subunit alcohol dehydrogenase family)